MTFQERAFLLLLQEWHQQLVAGLDAAKAELPPDPEPQRERRWRPHMFMLGPFRPPTEDDPSDQWEWIEIQRTPKHLYALEGVIDRIGEQIEALGNE